MAESKVAFFGHPRQYYNLKQEIDAAIREVLESGVYVLGPRLEKFERELAAYCGMKEAVGVNSGTDALWLAFKALGIGPGDEVITTANAYFATAEAIWIAGARAVFVDIEPATCNIDPSLIEPAVTPKTKAIVPVHLYGHPAKMREVAAVARKHQLLVIEDNAQAFGSRGDSFAPGELSDAMCTSFTAQKNLGCYGDGGAVLTHDSVVAHRIRQLRNHGSLLRGVYSMGYNSRLDEIQAAVLSVKLPHLDQWNDQRRALARGYSQGFAGASLRLPSELRGYRHVYQFYVVETDHREELRTFLDSRGITTLVHHTLAIHQQEGYPWGQSARMSGSLTHTERSVARVLSLPLYPELTNDEMNYVIESVREWDQKCGGEAG